MRIQKTIGRHLRQGAIGLVASATLALAPALAVAGIAPTPPQTFDTTYAAQSGATITVNAGGNLQTALNNAQLGDTIVLQSGATFTGPFTLPNKTTGTGWIVIRSSAYANLPAPGTRVSVADAANMPKIVVATGGESTIKTAANAHHFRFVGIEFKPIAGNFVYNLITIGAGDTSTSTLPSNITFDRCYIHGDPTVGGRRGIAMDGKFVSVRDSYVSDFKEAGADTQALWAYNTSGPIQILNNYLEAAGENVMFGGADSRAAELIPSDIEIRSNSFFKPTSWIGSAWTVKNLLEFKNAKRVLVQGNRFENNWAAAQNGFSLLITPRNQNGTAPWSGVQDVAIKANDFYNLGQGLNISGTDDVYPSQRTARVLIQNNIIRVTGLNGADARLFQVIGGPIDLTIDHNTGFAARSYMNAQNSPLADRFEFTNNIVSFGLYGFAGTDTGDGLSTLNRWFSNFTFSKNAIIGVAAAGASTSDYPAGNFFPADTAAVQFVNFSAGDYHLASSSPYKNAGTDGADLGANVDLMNAQPRGSVASPAPSSPAAAVPNPPSSIAIGP